jgi:hypothetical protein
VDRAPISSWLAQQQIDLGSSDGPATHALMVDAESNTAWVAPIALAHRIVADSHWSQSHDDQRHGHAVRVTLSEPSIGALSVWVPTRPAPASERSSGAAPFGRMLVTFYAHQLSANP